MSKRLMKKTQSRVPVIVAVIVIVLVLALLGGYAGFCMSLRGNGKLLPGTVARNESGSVEIDLSRMTAEEAEQAIRAHMGQELEQCSVTVIYLNGQRETLSGDYLEHDPAYCVDLAFRQKAEVPTLRLGLNWLGLGGSPEPVQLNAAQFTEDGRKAMDALIDRVRSKIFRVTDNQVRWDLVEEEGELYVEVEVTEGSSRGLDETDLREQLDRALIRGGDMILEARVIETGSRITGMELAELVYTEPQDPVELEDGRLSMPQDGFVMDPDVAQGVLNLAQPGKSFRVPVERIPYDFANCDPDLLYRDLLAENISSLDGVANRSFNVNRTAEFCNGTILMPGEVFSYLGCIGDPSVENGYMMSTGYLGGKTVEMEGGGACQISSALYYCMFYANLETVNRAAHAFSVSYVPRGLDATVYYPSLDFTFRNNRSFPVKIETFTDGKAAGKATVRIWGTKTDDSRVEAEITQLYRNPWETVYKPDASIPLGTTKVEITPYTGYGVEVYRCVYDGEGNLISRTYENTSRYARRDQVILFNPADAASLGLDATGKPLPEPTPEPIPTPTPTPEPTPTPTPEPTPTPTPTPAPEPTPTPTPTPTPEPTPTQEPEPGPGESETPAEPSPEETPVPAEALGE